MNLVFRQARPADYPELEFRMLAADPAVQGKGGGRAVVRLVIGHAESLPGIRAIRIRSATFKERARDLYESLSFQRVSERDRYVHGEDVLLSVFRLGLPPARISI